MMGETIQTTIAAIATPHGQGGIGVIRLSGPRSLPILSKIIRTPDQQGVEQPELKSNRPSLRTIFNPASGLPIDEALVTWFPAPRSFTGEDVVEISCHGSPVVLAEVLHLLTGLGADLAEPGEFTRRAFLNHRLDLAQAEAINDLISSQTTYQARLAARQVRGELSRQLQPLRQSLVDLIVHFESTVEFVEDDLDPLNLATFTLQIDEIIGKLERMAASHSLGRVIKSGVRLALIGRPNVGKSSIFNALLGRDRAIVTHFPGTTRDVLSEVLSINGLPVSIVDTAGIRQTEDPIEMIGVDRTRSTISEADLLIAVIESASELEAEEVSLFEEIPVNIFVVNKCDLGPILMRDKLSRLAGERPIVEISALSGLGLDRLREIIFQTITDGSLELDESFIITNERHYKAILDALAHVQWAKRDLAAGFTEEVALDNLHLALRSLGLITGETLIGDIINQIFTTFCIGK